MSNEKDRKAATVEDDLRDRFLRVLKHADSLNLTDEQLDSLDAVSDLRAHIALSRQSENWCRKGLTLTIFLGFLFLLAAIVSILTTEWPIPRRELVAWSFGFDSEDLSLSQCLLDVETPLLSLARPPVDCRICHGLKKIVRVSNISQETFEMKYAYSGRPVIVTDAMMNWTATQIFSFDFFRKIYAFGSHMLSQSETVNSCQFFPYKTNFTKLSEVFEMDDRRASMRDGSEPWYIGWSNCDPAAANILRAHYHRPYFLPGSAESSRTDWIFMGSPGYGAHLHIDNVNNPSWQAQITGVKRWILEPPPECYLECPERLEFTVYPGEIIVLDTNQWFHATEITGSEMSITIGSEYD